MPLKSKALETTTIQSDLRKRFLKFMKDVIAKGVASNKSDFAQMIGTTISRISEWEKGKGYPKEYNIEAAVVGFGLNANWLYSGRGDMYAQCDKQLDRIERLLVEIKNRL